MEAKWPFILITFTLLVLLAYTVVSLEKTVIMNNWNDHRCDLSVIVAASLFKPETDPRSSGQFAKDNFEFCTKNFVQSFIDIIMKPINFIFGQHLNLAGGAMGMLGNVRKIMQVLYNTFSSYVAGFFKKFNSAIFQISRIVQHIKMAVNRMSAIAMSMIYVGITLFRGMLNTIQFAIKVILIICAILIILLIILWFILFPIIPVIISTLGAVIAVVLSLAMVVSASVADDAKGKQGGFCFAEDTQIAVIDNGKVIEMRVQDITVGTLTTEGYITHVIQMDGSGISLYDIEGIYVSGSHLVLNKNGLWHAVETDDRACLTTKKSAILYCFNTTNNVIPVLPATSKTPILFRDWEEISNNDQKGQFIWNYLVLSILNGNSHYSYWKNDILKYCEVALVGKSVHIKTENGSIPISKLSLGDTVVDSKGNPQRILGIIYGEVEDVVDGDQMWRTECYERGVGMSGEVWSKGQSTVKYGVGVSAIGMSLITEGGEIVLYDWMSGKKEVVIRDFTEIGYDRIHVTYPFVESRLEYLSRCHSQHI
jgi:hypothetical protein